MVKGGRQEVTTEQKSRPDSAPPPALTRWCLVILGTCHGLDLIVPISPRDLSCSTLIGCFQSRDLKSALMLATGQPC